MKRTTLFFLTIIAALFLAACSNDQNEHANMNQSKKTVQVNKGNHEDMDNMDHDDMDNMEDMNHSSSGEVPQGLKKAENPTYKVGEQAIIKADHMEGMNGAEATIVGAYDTTAYVISYIPTTGGEKVKNHKWIIQEEIKGAGDATLKPGTEVTIEADHMKGMNGATGEIESAEKTTVYMIDYTPTTGGEKVTNHKWVTESELTAK